METWKKVFFPLVTLFIFFMVDGVIAFIFNGSLHTSLGFIVPRLTVVILIVFAFYLSSTNLFVLATIFGLLFDSYYTGILGPYVAAFLILVYLVARIQSVFKPGFLSYIIVGIAMLFVLEIFIFYFYKIIDLNTVTFMTFLQERLLATVLFNSMILILICVPLDRLSRYITDTNDYRYKNI